MDKKNEILKKVPLFEGLSDKEIQDITKCLSARERNYQHGSYLINEGDRVPDVGILLEGKLRILREDASGNAVIVTEIIPGDLFAEAFACAEVESCPLSVVADEDSVVLWINYKKVTKTCGFACEFHSRMIQNMLRLVAEKNILMNERISTLSKRSIREKIMEYLDNMRRKAGKNPFQVPFNRNAMADYLCTDRSSLSRELGKMQEEGLLNYEKNRFELFWEGDTKQ